MAYAADAPAARGTARTCGPERVRSSESSIRTTRDAHPALLGRVVLSALMPHSQHQFLEHPPGNTAMIRSLDQADLRNHQAWIRGDQSGRRLEYSGKTLSGDTSTGANLVAATFTNCCFDNMTFRGCDFTGAYFTDCTFAGCAFHTSYLQDTSFLRTDLAGVSFRGCPMPGCRFVQSALDRADLSDATLTKSTFHECTLKAADLRDAQLRRSTFSACSLRESSLVAATAERAGFLDVDLRGARVDEMLLSGTRFVRCGLAGLGGKPRLREVFLVEPDYSPAFDGSHIVSAEAVLRDWS